MNEMRLHKKSCVFYNKIENTDSADENNGNLAYRVQ